MKTFASIVLSLVAIVLCGGLGAIAGFGLARSLSLDGLAGALVAAMTAIVVATLLWIAGVAALRGLGWLK